MKNKLIGLGASAGAFLVTAPAVFAINVGSIQGSKGFATNIGAVITSVISFVMALAALLVF